MDFCHRSRDMISTKSQKNGTNKTLRVILAQNTSNQEATLTRCRLNCCASYFTDCCINVWNSLLEEDVNASSTRVFTHKLGCIVLIFLVFKFYLVYFVLGLSFLSLSGKV